MAPQIEVITRRERFAEIKPHWDALWRRCAADVFQTHTWIATWLDVIPWIRGAAHCGGVGR